MRGIYFIPKFKKSANTTRSMAHQNTLLRHTLVAICKITNFVVEINLKSTLDHKSTDDTGVLNGHLNGLAFLGGGLATMAFGVIEIGEYIYLVINF